MSDQSPTAPSKLLRHHPDLLRQRGAPPRPRVLDDGRRHPRPAHAPARGGRLLPDRHRRARRAGRAGGRARGDHAAGARRPQRGEVPRADADHRRHQRLLHPHLRPAPHRPGRGGDAARLRQRLGHQGDLRRLVLPALRRLQNRARARPRQHLPDPRDRAREGDRGELVLPALRLPGAARAPLRGAAGLRRPRLPPQRGARLHQAGPRGRLALAADAELGDAAALGPRPAHVRLVRRAPQLLHGPRLRPRRART